MHGHRIEKFEDPGPLRVPAALTYACLGLGIACLLAFFGFAFMSSDEKAVRFAWAGFFVSTHFFLFLAFGAAAFLAINYITNAKWFVVIKRVPEAIASYAFGPGVVLALLCLLGMSALYSWADPAADYPYAGTLKDTWLSPPVHAVKVLVYLVPVAVLSFLMVRSSTGQDRTKDPADSDNTFKFAIAYIIVFAVLFSMYGWDAVMSLSPKWFSTMFGVYCFAGAFVSSIALSLLITFAIRAKNPYIAERHVYDLGTYVMGFSTFMVYIGFSQFMLIWYANIPDETFFYMDRYGGWLGVTIALPILKWVIPFFLLMFPPMRTSIIGQGIACSAVLFGQVLDLYWIVFPTYSARALVLPSFLNVVTFIGVGGIFLYSVLSFLSKHSVLPVGDPRLSSSVNGDYLHA